MTDSLCRKRKLADSFIPCDIIPTDFSLLCRIFIVCQTQDSKHLVERDVKVSERSK